MAEEFMLVVNKDPHLQKYRARLDARRNRAILEPLEVRALLSASIQITGHGHTIAFNDTKPSTFDATDFRQMSTTVDATVGTMSHTFTINNNGDADLTSIQVTVTGPDF